MKCIFNLCYWIFIFPAAVDCIICQSHLMLRNLTLLCQTVEGYTNFFISCFSLILAPSFFTFSISSMVCLGGVFVFLDFCRNHKFSDLLIQLFINWYHNQHGSIICKKKTTNTSTDYGIDVSQIWTHQKTIMTQDHRRNYASMTFNWPSFRSLDSSCFQLMKGAWPQETREV